MKDAVATSPASATVFVDTIVFMYLAGDDPVRRMRCRSALPQQSSDVSR